MLERKRIANAWKGRISGCLLGKPIEAFSMNVGHQVLTDFLNKVDALPLRDYVPLGEEINTASLRKCCKGNIVRAEPDDDTNYSVLALIMLEEHGLQLSTEQVARAWMRYLPGGATYTAERSAYATLLKKTSVDFAYGADPEFDLAECSDNEWSDWIGAQIRTDVYGWVSPGNPQQAARLASCDAALSHRGDGVYGAVFVAAFGAAIPACDTLEQALQSALEHIPIESEAAKAVVFASSLVGSEDAVAQIHARYAELTPVHTVNNLALVVWALLSHTDDYSSAIGSVVAAGWDTDCNGATVGGLWGLQGKDIPSHWTQAWAGRVALMLTGIGEVSVEALIDRTLAVAERLETNG